ncbi:Myc-type basic helix-loop-helix (bHLH) domain-containing protein [Dioscorea alata]|uniref:Myc-type basic helix-loop-helix (BHLH) domain-containing protein n=1 Tax=Dioscorea alata TaxID=55571 RepID=A0ACB7WTM0_DIOAL|nr:Myc-type basic helix-loop-helix (bHLH) domain-containing protein [Dioscorea alata]
MELDRAEDYLIDDSGMGSDGELRRAIEILCEFHPMSGVQMGDAYIGDGAIQQMDSSNGVDLGIIYGGSCNLEKTNSGNMGLAYQDACTVECTNAGTSVDTMLVHGDNVSLEEHNTRKRAMDEDCSRSKSKACREKLRRDKLNDRFLELSSALEPGRPPKSDKASILSDAARVLEQLKAEAQELKIANEKLQETIKDLKAEKNELRDEKTRLKEEKEKLEQQVKSMSMPPVGYMPHPVVIHPCAMAPGFAPAAPSPANKPGPFATFPSVPMWQWMPSAFVDTTQDAKLWPPNA